MIGIGVHVIRYGPLGQWYRNAMFPVVLTLLSTFSVKHLISACHSWGCAFRSLYNDFSSFHYRGEMLFTLVKQYNLHTYNHFYYNYSSVLCNIADPAAQLTQMELKMLPWIPPPNGLDYDFNGPHPWRKSATFVTILFVALALMSCAIRYFDKIVEAVEIFLGRLRVLSQQFHQSCWKSKMISLIESAVICTIGLVCLSRSPLVLRLM